MSPDFSVAFDPVMLEVLDLVDRVAAGTVTDSEAERAKVRGSIDRAASRIAGSRSRDWELASYALAALVDELLIAEVVWAGQAWWENHTLERELFNTRNRATEFFERAEQAASLASRDALEAYVTAVVLGFKGMLRGQPEALKAWLQRHQQLLRVGHGRPQVADTTVDLAGALPLTGRTSLMWATLATAFAAATVVVAIWHRFLAA
jgi:type IV/VI secretion system ImpK/VasF family protein